MNKLGRGLKWSLPMKTGGEAYYMSFSDLPFVVRQQLAFSHTSSVVSEVFRGVRIVLQRSTGADE